MIGESGVSPRMSRPILLLTNSRSIQYSLDLLSLLASDLLTYVRCVFGLITRGGVPMSQVPRVPRYGVQPFELHPNSESAY